MSEFKDKTLLITGGTGSFGHCVLDHFLESDIGEIRIFSRDEKKQDDMRHELQAFYPEFYSKVRFFIGDVRDIQSPKIRQYTRPKISPGRKTSTQDFVTGNRKRPAR